MEGKTNFSVKKNIANSSATSITNVTLVSPTISGNITCDTLHTNTLYLDSELTTTTINALVRETSGKVNVNRSQYCTDFN